MRLLAPASLRASAEVREAAEEVALEKAFTRWPLR